MTISYSDFLNETLSKLNQNGIRNLAHLAVQVVFYKKRQVSVADGIQPALTG
jgi:hypothetical protein